MDISNAPPFEPADTDSVTNHIGRPGLWRPVLLALTVLLSMGAAVLWNWMVLEDRTQRESQRRFALEVEALGEQVRARMQAYELALRGLASAFTGQDTPVSHDLWIDISEQLELQSLYPGISSLVWARYVPASSKSEFLTRVRADGRPNFQIFPEAPRQQYLPVEYISPINPRTLRVVGLDLLSQHPQNQSIWQAIDSGEAVLSPPLPDLYALSPERSRPMGILMFFPVYQSGVPPDTLQERRATFLGMADIAFLGQELARGIFGTQLHLFHIVAHDAQVAEPLFDSLGKQPPRNAPPNWRPRFHHQLELLLYGRVWQLDITGTPEYERGLAVADNSNAFSLVLGLAVSALLALLTGGGLYQRDRKLHASQQVAARLREQAEQLILANRYKSEFLANMSHELRTPLNSILILSDQLRQNQAGNLSDKQTRHADIVHRAGHDLLQLINDILDLARIEAGRMKINLEPINLQDVLVNMDAAMRPQAEAKGLNLHVLPLPPGGSVPPRVYSDPVRLDQILRNLLSNAIKFTDHGDVHVIISAGETLEDGRIMVNFAVRDTGIGIDPAQHQQAFQEFAQLDGSTRRRFGGTGLGLPITRRLAQALGGDIELESALGQGSTFTVRLPMQSAEFSTQSDTVAQPLPPQRSGNGPALLLVEDDANFAAIVIEQAQASGFASVHCSTGQQALDLLRTESFVAVVMDILLPDISGWQLFRRLRAQPQHRNTPVHIISCLPEPGGLNEEGVRYLTKPISREALEDIFSGLPQRPTQASAPTVLLVEDEADEREHYCERLTAQGFSVTACDGAEQAGAAWAEARFDVLVIDLNLPDQDGFSLLDSLNQMRSLQGTRIVVNTGVDVTAQGLQRLHDYCAVVVHKSGNDTHTLGQAIQGFLGQLGATTKAATPPVERAAPAATHSTPVTAGRRLLLVDDDVRNLYAMSALLDDFDVHVSTAENGEQAITCYQQEPLDLILMDMSMPVMDGYTATNLLKTRHGCTIPIIALTAHAMKGDREKCLAAGADDYLAKPVQREALRTILERWMVGAVTEN